MGSPLRCALVDHGAQLFVGELERVVAGHDLDQVGAAAHLLAHGAAHLVGAAGLAAAPVGVAAGLDDGLAADEQARAGEDALGHGLLGKEVGLVHAQVAHGGDAGAQADEHVAGGLVGADLGRVVHRLPRQVVDAVPGEMGVAVDQPGQDGAAGRLAAVAALAEVGGAADGRDLAALDFDKAVFDDLVADAGQDAADAGSPARPAGRTSGG